MKPAPFQFTSGITKEQTAQREAVRARLGAAGWCIERSNLPKDLRWHEYAPHLRPSTTLDRPEQEIAMEAFDHPYRLMHETGLTVYVGEPYKVPRDLKQLCGDRYVYVVQGEDWAMHNPGVTVAIWFYRTDEAERVESLLPKETKS